MEAFVFCCGVAYELRPGCLLSSQNRDIQISSLGTCFVDQTRRFSKNSWEKSRAFHRWRARRDLNPQPTDP